MRVKDVVLAILTIHVIMLCVHVHRQVHAFLHDTKTSWLVHMETKAANRQDLAADVWSEVEYQLGSQWFVLLRDHAVRCASEEHAAWAKYRTYCEVLSVDSLIRISFKNLHLFYACSKYKC